MRRSGRAPARPAAALVACLSLLLPSGCARNGPASRLRASPPRNLLLVTIDTLRADRLGCYGYGAARTPALDALAAEGVRFDEVLTPAPLTLPAHASLLSGRLPATHGVHANGRDRLPDSIPTLGEALAGALPRRGAIVASVVLDRLFGLERGFVEYDDRLPPPAPDRPLAPRERRAAEVATLAETWLGRSRDPFLLWVHLFDPHAPYEAPAEWTAGGAHPYDAEVSYADAALGRILADLARDGRLEETLVVVAGDHGEALGEHGEPTHGVFLYDATVRVPLLLRYPRGLPAGHTVKGTVRLIDLMPTLLDIFGAPPPPGLQGRSLLPLLSGAQEEPPATENPHLEAVLETRLPEEQYGWSPLTGLRAGSWKYIAAPEEELYDLASDPGEIRNLARERAEQTADLRARLDRAVAASGVIERAPARPSPELIRQLESLGYVGGKGAEGSGGDPRPAGAGPIAAPAPDPKHRARLLAPLDAAAAAFEAGRFEESASRFASILSDDPGNPFARRHHARSLLALGREAEGEREYRRLLEDNPGDVEALHTLGARALRAGRLDEAEPLLRAAARAAPWDPRIGNSLAYLAARAGDLAAARKQLQEILARHPFMTEAALNLAALERRAGRAQEAERILRDFLQRAPEEASARRALAGLLREEGRAEEAQALERAMERAPELPPRP